MFDPDSILLSDYALDNTWQRPPAGLVFDGTHYLYAYDLDGTIMLNRIRPQDGAKEPI